MAQTGTFMCYCFVEISLFVHGSSGPCPRDGYPSWDKVGKESLIHVALISLVTELGLRLSMIYLKTLERNFPKTSQWLSRTIAPC